MKVETLLVCSLFQVLLVVLSFQSTAGIQCACYSCKETNYTCVTDGYCYTSAIRLKDDSVKYLSQCLDKRNFFPPIDPFVCKLPSYHCCSTDFCNRDSKPLPPEPKAQSIQCACDYCELTNYTCVTDGYCIRQTDKLGDGSVKYFHRCLDKKHFFPPSDPFVCRDTSYLCCSTDFCNKDSKPVAPEPKGCSFPDLDFPNGIVKYQSQEDVNKAFVDEYYTLQFVCSPRYYRLGPKYIQCIDGDWTDDIPSCAIKECPSPPNIENASFLIKSGANKAPTLGSSTVYTCDFGFELNNPQEDTLRCGLGRKSKTAKWFGELPACKAKMSCPDPGVSKHGSVKGDCCFSGSVLRFSCNEGYELVGEEKILCLPMGVWSSDRPLCRPLGEHCDLPPPIPHGFVTGDKDGDYFLPEDEAQIECEPGYVSKGSQSVVCEEGGEWDADFEECTKIFCDPPPPLAHGTIPELLSTNSTSFPYDFRISYICDAGYRLVNGDSWRFCKKRGWSGKTPHCEVIQCPDPGTPENGKKVGDSYTIGSKVQFACFPGYDLLGSIERFCMPNGQWSGDIARCDLPSNYCPNPGVPVNGFKSSSNYDLNSRISFHCRSGYIQIGSPVRECLVNHTWSGTETKCQAPFDFDNGPQVGVTLQAKLTEKAEEQRLELQKYREAQKSPRGRMLDLNYPGRIILYFAFDVSGSIGEQNFAESIRFAKAVVEKVGISEDGARAGAVVFSSEAEAEFLPLNFVTTKEVLDALDRIKYKKGGTAASSAIAFIRDDIALVSAPENLGRDNIKYAIFLLTDGRVNMGGDPKEQAELLKKAGVEIYCIGITGDPKMETLYQIASTSKTPNGQEHPNVYILQNYATLSWLVQNITKGSVDYSQCGLGLENVGNNANRGRIIGGEKSKDPWPWMAALYMYTGSIDKPYDLKCGGSIIHRNFILTAAHCMYHKNGTERHKNHVLIKLGLTDINNVSSVQEFEILKKHAHPGYVHGRYFDNDIALLQLSRDIQFNALVRPVCLPPKDLPEDSLLYSPKEFAFATGWGHEGKVSKHGAFVRKKVSQELKEIPLPIQSRDRCSKSVADNGFNVSAAFTDRMFCAGDGQGGNDTCEGDSGGPLMQSQLNQEGFVYWTQVGIVSWGIGCAQENTYGYYTYVQKFIPWIEDTIERALKQKI